MKSINLSKPMIAFLVIAFGIPWLGWILPHFMNLDDSILAYLKYVGDFCSIGGLVAAYVAQGKTGLVALLSRTIRFRVPAAWWLLTLLIPFSYVSLAFLLGGQVVQSTGPLDLGKFWGIFSVPALAAFLTGPIGEELGWRGFLVPELFKKHSLLVSSVMTGVLWGLWHYPLYYDGIFASLNIALLFVAGTITTSILMSIIFVHTRASVLVAILYHWLTNVLPITFYRMFGISGIDLTIETLQVVGKVAAIALLYGLIGAGAIGRKKAQIVDELHMHPTRAPGARMAP